MLDKKLERKYIDKGDVPFLDKGDVPFLSPLLKRPPLITRQLFCCSGSALPYATVLSARASSQLPSILAILNGLGETYRNKYRRDKIPVK